MTLNMIRAIRGIACLMLFVILFTVIPQETYSHDLKVGARGGGVWELQGRLNLLGYYKGKVDGQFGWMTYNSVRTFQWKFGMKVDGVAGSKTLQMLRKATPNYGKTGGTATGGSTRLVQTSRFNKQDIRLLAQTVHGEARGEPYIGQVAVAAVVLNRLSSPLFPNTVSGVIFQPGAFTAVADGQIWLEPKSAAYKAVNDAVNGWDPSGNAIYYFNPATATSNWIWGRAQIKRIGKHIFTK